jgi:hypothetical protein
MSLSQRLIVGSIVYFVSGAFFSFVLSLLVALVGIVLFGSIALVIGLFNGTGSTFVEFYAFDGARLCVILWYVRSAYRLLMHWNRALIHIRDRYEAEHNLSGGYPE